MRSQVSSQCSEPNGSISVGILRFVKCLPLTMEIIDDRRTCPRHCTFSGFGVARAAWQSDRHRKTGIRRHRTETEFLPAALEVLESLASPTARYTFCALVAFLLASTEERCVGKECLSTCNSGWAPAHS